MENIGTAIIVLNKKGEILMGKRGNVYGAGFYGMPGGRIELKEPVIDTVKRELMEETGLNTEHADFMGIVRELQGDYNFIHFGFLVKDFPGDPQNKEPEKCEGWEWISLDKLPESILPGHKAIIDLYINKETPAYRELL